MPACVVSHDGFPFSPQELKDPTVAHFNLEWPKTVSLFRYFQRVDPGSLTRQWHLTPSLAADIWHLVSVDLPVLQLLVVHICLEFLVLLASACALQLVCVFQWLAGSGDQAAVVPSF